jgi:hypothetical protein
MLVSITGIGLTWRQQQHQETKITPHTRNKEFNLIHSITMTTSYYLGQGIIVNSFHFLKGNVKKEED